MNRKTKQNKTKHLTGYFLAGTIHLGIEETATSPGDLAICLLFMNGHFLMVSTEPNRDHNLELSARKTQAAIWEVRSPQYKEMTHT